MNLTKKSMLVDFLFSPNGLNLKPKMFTPKPDKDGAKVQAVKILQRQGREVPVSFTGGVRSVVPFCPVSDFATYRPDDITVGMHSDKHRHIFQSTQYRIGRKNGIYKSFGRVVLSKGGECRCEAFENARAVLLRCSPYQHFQILANREISRPTARPNAVAHKAICQSPHALQSVAICSPLGPM